MKLVNTLKISLVSTVLTVAGLTLFSESALSKPPIIGKSLTSIIADANYHLGVRLLCERPQQPLSWINVLGNRVCTVTPRSEPTSVTDPAVVASLQALLGKTQEAAFLPQVTQRGLWRFLGVPSGHWFDPPTAEGFRFTTTDGSLFTHIMDFPTGIDADNLFTVSVGDRIFGQFGPGQSVDFGDGVSEFTVTGINPLVDPENPLAFPIQLAFNAETASFDMQAIRS